ncbi:MAG TPA: GAF domain-containing protein, partial [Anaerolineaceae bacterium]|nr:GAF domain-containing protein [Anaerolineaceae bacterium]
LYTTHFFSHFWSLGLVLTGGALFNLALIFPSEDPIAQRFPIVRDLGYFVAALSVGFTFFSLFNFNFPDLYIYAWRVGFVVTGVMALFAIAWMLFRRYRLVSPAEREQVRVVLWAALLSFGPMVVWFLFTPIFVENLPFSPFLLLPLAIFPVMASYAVQRYRMLQADYVLSRAVLYAFMGVLIAGGYALLLSGAGVLLTGMGMSVTPAFVGLIIFVLALLITPLRQRMEAMVDALFFRGQRAYQERLQTFSGELTSVADLPSIVRIMRGYVERSLSPSRLHIFIQDILSEQYIATPDARGQLTSDMRFPLNSALVQMMLNQREAIYLSNQGVIPDQLKTEQSRIALLGAQLFVPLPGRERLTGWLALGPHLSGEPYSGRELNFLSALCDQSSLAIERGQVVVNMENRVRQMNVLSRVAQGVNITINLDDIYELIYAQAVQIIPADDFDLLLVDPETNQLVQAFNVEMDERISEKENVIVPPAQTLVQEVIRQRRPIFTDDYARECQKRAVIPTKTGVYAWMSVPLNAGAETIGALTLAKRDTSINYTAEQMGLLQSISDQVAGAIVKARLLSEAERRARQLSTLNEVTRQLTSNLASEPLLQNILDSAVEILNCEAGSLLLVDEQTDELVFRVTVGPVAKDLQGRRMAPGAGLVGKAVKTHQPIIVNDVQSSPEWFKGTDKQTGFLTQTLLVVPMMVKDVVIGVIEVLNKKDTTPFNRDDQYLLSAFAAQAAVAIENARLYTNTDQALTARVEELSVMQRIDRELNTSLEISRAMRITLEWAMRQSGAAAGLVGVVQEQGIQIMASEGYTDELEPYKENLLPLTTVDLEEVAQSGAPRRLVLESEKPGLLRGARSQTILPIRRESNTVGLILLENLTPEAASDEALTFLLRLSDHAAIAISNAQLYAAVQEANIAKSEFVSFVSHELKNPMTSIKGYTELLAAGAVGPITDAQANFLATIRSNVERMSTLVSDLADVSRIEAGRLRLDFKAHAVREAVEEVVRSLKRQIDDKGQTLELQMADDLPQVWSDRTRMVQVTTNLISNAYKYTPNGGRIIVGAEVADNQWDPNGAARVVHLWVNDSGIGISPEDQKKIFTKFFRSEDPKTREAPGTGLGLNITRSLVEMQGGKIWFESEFRKGTTFHFTVPVAE